MLSERFDCVKLIDATRCNVIALAERQATQPLSSLFEFEPENERLDRVTALRTLLSAQLHQAFSEDNLTQPQQIALEKAAQALTRDYAQVAMSLAWHYLNEGPAANDARVRTLRDNFKKEMEQGGIALIANEPEAIDKARKLARASAEDLLVTAKGDEKLRTMITALAKAAGDSVGTPLTAKPQLIGMEIDESDFTRRVTRKFLARYLEEQQQRALGKTSYDYAGVIPGLN